MIDGSLDADGVPLGSLEGDELGFPVGPVGASVNVGLGEGAGVGTFEIEGTGVIVGEIEGDGEGIGDSVGAGDELGATEICCS
jgi:hypothetical protein